MYGSRMEDKNTLSPKRSQSADIVWENLDGADIDGMEYKGIEDEG